VDLMKKTASSQPVLTFRSLDEQEAVFATEPLPRQWPLEVWFASVYDLPLGQFTPSDLARSCRQNIHLGVVVPLCLEVLAREPLAGELYDAELLSAVMGVPQDYWQAHDEQRQRMLDIAAAVLTPSSQQEAGNEDLRCEVEQFISTVGEGKQR
jgi:hypothetical protein